MESDEPTREVGAQAYAHEVAAVQERIRALEVGSLDNATEALVQDLETAHEMLRVAHEELRVQQDLISQLSQDQLLLRWQQERMLAILPVPVLTTQPPGVIRSVNASAATLFQMRVAEMVGKPVLSMIAPEDRTDIRRLLGDLSRDGATFRRVVGVQGRDGELTKMELFASQLPGEPPEVTWMLLAGAPADRGPRSAAAVPEALTQLALLPTTVSDVQEVLSRAAVLCQESLGPTTSVSLSVGPPHAPTSVATTSQAAQTVDGAQLTAGEGPSIAAFAEATIVESHDVRNDRRWRLLGEHAPATLQGAISVPLEVGDAVGGTLSVYVSEPSWPPRLREDSVLLASTLGAVLFELGLKQELERLATELGRALESRAVIDQAKGIVMADRQVDAQGAFEHLVRLSSTQHAKLRDIAQQIVDGVSDPS